MLHRIQTPFLEPLLLLLALPELKLAKLLYSMEFDKNRFGDVDLGPALMGLGALTRLCINDVDDMKGGCLSQLPNKGLLKALDLCNTTVSKAALLQLTDFAALTELNVSWGPQVSEAVVKELGGSCGQLSALNISSRKDAARPSVFPNLPSLASTLSSLTACSVNCAGPGLSSLQHLSSLRQLMLSHKNHQAEPSHPLAQLVANQGQVAAASPAVKGPPASGLPLQQLTCLEVLWLDNFCNDIISLGSEPHFGNYMPHLTELNIGRFAMPQGGFAMLLVRLRHLSMRSNHAYPNCNKGRAHNTLVA